MNKEKPPVLNRIEAILRAEETADLLPPWSCLPVGDTKWIELKAKRIEPLIQQAEMKGWRKGNELKQKRLDIKLKMAKAEVAREIQEWGQELCYEHYAGNVLRRQCDNCWQELESKYMEGMRKKLARMLAFQALQDDELDTEDEVWAWVIRNVFQLEWYNKADQILSLLKEEIKKVENPYISDGSPFLPSTHANSGFEECRQAILKILEGDAQG